MDQHAQQRGRSPSAGHQQPHINQTHSPSPGYITNEPSVGLGLGLDQSSGAQPFQSTSSNNNDFGSFNEASNFLNNQQTAQSFDQTTLNDPAAFAANQGQSQNSFLDPSFAGNDFSLFPPGNATQGDQFNSPLFDQSLSPDMNAMAMAQGHHSPTPPHLLNPEGHQASSAHQSPSFNQQPQFTSPPGGHSRHASLGPEAALLPNQLNEWSQPQFQGHRRSPSAHSDISSAAPSPNLVSSDTFDTGSSHSPMQRPQDPSMYPQIQGFDNFTISDPVHSSPNLHSHSSPNLHSRSPSHSPAISPRLPPQSLPEINQPTFGIGMQDAGYAGMANEPFPSLQQHGDMSQMAAPAINIEFAPTANKSLFEPPKPPMDQDSLTPPERGRPRSRPRAVTDPFNSGGAAVIIGRPHRNSDGLSPHLNADSSRSLSPLDRSGTSPSRRRQSTGAVPNNEMALRLADPEYQNTHESGNPKRVQKHPATFQCTLCPKRFTRAYNLRSHLRTHTDERPFVCTVCGKAFARQHDRKRHEGLHSGEKKFVCKGDLKTGGQWGCGRRFARADALGRHFRSEAGRICIKPLLDEEMLERQRAWQEQRMQQNMAQSMAVAQPPMGLDPNGYPMDTSAGWLPQALLTQYPALAGMQWSGPDASSGMEDDLSGRSSFDASDYEGDESGYVSTGTGFGDGSMNQNYGEVGYASDYGR